MMEGEPHPCYSHVQEVVSWMPLFASSRRFFLFQAEDGIRYLYVTGVQTCALPIWPGTASNQPAVAEPTYAERARTLVHLGRVGSLSTLSRKQPGFPFGSVMPYGLDDRGRAIFLISAMAMHTQNLQSDPRASLLVTQADANGDPLGASRVTLVGNALTIPQPQVADARK